MSVYTCVIVIVTWKLFIFERHFNWVCLFGYGVSILLYVLWLIVADNVSSTKTYLSLRVTTLTARFWFGVFVSCAFCLLIDYAVVHALRFFRVNPGLRLMQWRDNIRQKKREFMDLLVLHRRLSALKCCPRIRAEVTRCKKRRPRRD